jgi:hypothetical protein
MNSLLERFSNWLFSITDPGKKLTLQRDRLLSLLVDIRGQYKKFLLLSPRVQLELDDIIDEMRGSLPVSAKKIFKDLNRIYLEDSYLLPPGDYKKAIEQNDILRLANERLHLSNEDLRMSNDRLLHQVEELQSKKSDEGSKDGTASV